MHIFRDFKIPQDIVFDEDANTVTITVGDVSKYPGHVSTINFHDFDTVSRFCGIITALFLSSLSYFND